MEKLNMTARKAEAVSVGSDGYVDVFEAVGDKPDNGEWIYFVSYGQRELTGGVFFKADDRILSDYVKYDFDGIEFWDSVKVWYKAPDYENILFGGD